MVWLAKLTFLMLTLSNVIQKQYGIQDDDIIITSQHFVIENL